MKKRFLIIQAIALAVFSLTPISGAEQPVFAQIGEFRPDYDLRTRQMLNYTRLEQEKYWAKNVFQRKKEFSNWPGDTEGRTLLAWVLLAQATGQEPHYLDEMMAMWPDEVNPRGYFGKIYKDGISEQQLASHGWVLRALAELGQWKPGGPARAFAEPIIENLFLPTAGAYAKYPIDPADREEAGSYSGTKLKQMGDWIVSTDVGCYAIGMSGVIDAYAAFGDERLIPLVNEMIDRFLEIDLVSIRAQTHATLTACRGMLRWADLANRPELIDEVEKIYGQYIRDAWTETYGNYNWFNRPVWTEPCAIVDSLMTAMELWRHTGRKQYLEQAQLIYFNGLGHAQRTNGGFGCDNCPGADGTTVLKFQIPEAHWCCTMRGGEGLSRVSQYQVAIDEDTLLLPFGLAGTYKDLEVETEYPKAAKWVLTNKGKQSLSIKLFVPEWVSGVDGDARLNGESFWKSIELKPGEAKTVSGTLKEGKRDVLTATLGQKPNMKGYKVKYKGPLVYAKYGRNWKPICDDYLRGDMSKAHSEKQLLIK